MSFIDNMNKRDKRNLRYLEKKVLKYEGQSIQYARSGKQKLKKKAERNYFKWRKRLDNYETFIWRKQKSDVAPKIYRKLRYKRKKKYKRHTTSWLPFR